MNTLDNPVWTSETALIWIARIAGAVAGSAISLGYILPKGRREAAMRFAVGLICGMVFGSATGIKIAEKLELIESLGRAELMLMGSAVASLAAWSALGVCNRFVERLKVNPSLCDVDLRKKTQSKEVEKHE
ncbi:DUF6107 family protein [Brucellaceae bacterium C25G]